MAQPVHLTPTNGTARSEAAWRFCVAPMLDWTDRHCRFFLRLLSRQARLYTEMVTTGALLHGDAARFLRFDPSEHPVALQLGGSDPAALAACAALGEGAGYDEINLNCGCPSDRVQEGRFGACLMKEPERVAQAVAAMRQATSLPVTVKSRIGVDDSEDYPFLHRFVDTVAAAGCTTFIIHARKAWLKGLSPRENREIPPLRYEVVQRLKADFPQLRIVLNGGLREYAEIVRQFHQLDGVMVGREAYENPWSLTAVDPLLGTPAPVASREEALRRFLPYVERQLQEGVPLAAMTRHILGLYRGQPGGRAFRRILSEGAAHRGGGLEVIESALAAVQPDRLAAAA